MVADPGSTCLGYTVGEALAEARVDVVLDARGRGKAPQGKLKLRFERREQAWSYQCKGRRGDWAGEWADDGIVDADAHGVPAALPVQVTVGGFLRSGLAPVGYSAKAGRGGKASK